MGRGYEMALYRELVGRLREARPDLALSTDLIVGFPGETEEDFQETLRLVEETRFSQVYAFKYSPRPFTAAPRLDGRVDDEVASRRLQELFEVQREIQHALNEEMVGTTSQVLVTGWGKEAGSQTGRTTCHRVVNFTSDDGTGRRPRQPRHGRDHPRLAAQPDRPARRLSRRSRSSGRSRAAIQSIQPDPEPEPQCRRGDLTADRRSRRIAHGRHRRAKSAWRSRG